MSGKRIKTHQLSPGDSSNCNQFIQRHQVIQRWKSLDPSPQLRIEPAKHWTGRWVMVISQKQLRCELLPSLNRQEAQDIALLLKCFAVSLEFGDDGRLVDRAKIYSLLQVYLSRPSAFALIKRQVQGVRSEIETGAKGVELWA